MPHYSQWKIEYDDQWIIDNFEGRCTRDFVKKYSEHTGKSINADTLRHHIHSALGIKQHTWKFNFTEEMLEYYKTHYPSTGLQKFVKNFNEKFGTKLSLDYIRNQAKKMNLYVDKQVAYNNRHPLREWQDKTIYEQGTVRECKDGYPVIKIGSKWIPYRKYLYEQHYGKVPKGYSVTYLGDPKDYSLDNLVAIPRNHVLLLTSHNLRSSEKEITKTSVKLCELYTLLKTNEREVEI